MHLIHYASEYYDPVKAHEYYMRTRELKGRRSTSGLNEQGKNAASYVKMRVDAERKQKLEEAKADRTSRLDSAKEQKAREITQYASRMNADIERLRAKLKNMTPEAKRRNQEKISLQIANLRADNAEKKNEVNAAYGRTSARIKTDYTKAAEDIKSRYDEVYLSELDKIKQNSEFLATKKGKGSSSSGGSKGSKKDSSWKPYTLADLRRDTGKEKKTKTKTNGGQGGR